MPGPGTWSAGDILTAADLNAIGTWTSYTPAVVQSTAVAATVNYAKYMQINKSVIVNVDLTCTTSGTGSNTITVSLPVNVSGTSATGSMGSGLVFDSSTTNVILVSVIRASASTVKFIAEDTNNTTNTLGSSPALTLANNDVISFSLMYESV